MQMLGSIFDGSAGFRGYSGFLVVNNSPSYMKTNFSSQIVYNDYHKTLHTQSQSLT